MANGALGNIIKMNGFTRIIITDLDKNPCYVRDVSPNNSITIEELVENLERRHSSINWIYKDDKNGR
tara:strand:- start:4203 stop:4403 length:201 start_codon:yes stop_codon:yes gene_type:complete